MPPRVYVETSVVSYLAARPTSGLVTDARQRLTYAWRTTCRGAFELVVAQPVLTEAAGGDPAAAAGRLPSLAGPPQLAVTDEAQALAGALERLARLPAKADALHIALATVHGVDYLLTWNMRHVANAELRPAIEAACRRAGNAPPVIVTPDELMGGARRRGGRTTRGGSGRRRPRPGTG